MKQPKARILVVEDDTALLRGAGAGRRSGHATAGTGRGPADRRRQNRPGPRGHGAGGAISLSDYTPTGLGGRI